MGDKLRAIIGADELGGAMLRDGLFHQCNHIGRLQGPVGPQHMTLSGVLIKDREHAQGPTAHRRIGDEVPSPDMPTMGGLGRQAR